MQVASPGMTVQLFVAIVGSFRSVRLFSVRPAPPAPFPRAAGPTLRSLRVVIHVAFYLSLSFTATGSVVLRRNLFIRIYVRTLTLRLYYLLLSLDHKYNLCKFTF